VRRVFLCMFMFQYSPGNTVNNATSFYTLFPRRREFIFELQQFPFKQRFLELADEFLPVREGRRQMSYQKKMISPISA